MRVFSGWFLPIFMFPRALHGMPRYLTMRAVLTNSPSSGPCTRSSGTCCACVFITRCHSTSFLISPSSCPRKSLHMASTRAVSWPLFPPLSVTKWPTYHTNPSKFASNREILFCANEPQKRENASEWGVKTWNFRPLSIVIWCILCPFQALELWSHVSDNVVTHCKSA